MDVKLKNQVNMIVKFITAIFKPVDVQVISYENPERYAIEFYFDEIDDKYITNPFFSTAKSLKEINLNREIRKYIKDFLQIKTSGLQPPDFFPPEEKHPITTFVRHTDNMVK